MIEIPEFFGSCAHDYPGDETDLICVAWFCGECNGWVSRHFTPVPDRASE